MRRQKLVPRKSMSIAIAAVLACSTAPLYAGSDMEIGTNGANGANGVGSVVGVMFEVTPGQPGGNGGNNLFTNGAVTNDPSNVGNGTGGSGGNGGNGASSGPLHSPGGNGGDGGGGNSTAEQSDPVGGVVSDQATATGGLEEMAAPAQNNRFLLSLLPAAAVEMAGMPLPRPQL